jgi:hypothetical protein
VSKKQKKMAEQADVATRVRAMMAKKASSHEKKQKDAFELALQELEQKVDANRDADEYRIGTGLATNTLAFVKREFFNQGLSVRDVIGMQSGFVVQFPVSAAESEGFTSTGNYENGFDK